MLIIFSRRLEHASGPITHLSELLVPFLCGVLPLSAQLQVVHYSIFLHLIA